MRLRRTHILVESVDTRYMAVEGDSHTEPHAVAVGTALSWIQRVAVDMPPQGLPLVVVPAKPPRMFPQICKRYLGHL